MITCILAIEIVQYKMYFNNPICSGPCDVHILAKNNAIIDWRKLMGPTKVYQSQFSHPETIRGCFGLTDTRNAVHGSGNYYRMSFLL